MRVRRTPHAHFSLDLSPAERSVLHSLTDELIVLLQNRSVGSTGLPRDPALERLLPSAYRDDDAASAEFRRFTEDELVTAKVADASAVQAAAAGADEIMLDSSSAKPWLRSITDLRLALAVRLGVREDGDEGDGSAEAEPARQMYSWLGYLQELILEAL
jgi:hypothetical protein